MIIGAHSIIYSTKPDADRAFLRDVFGMPNVDVGDGWLIFGLPPAEVAVHPSGKNDDDVQAFMAEMKERRVACGAVHDQGWGVLTHVTLPGGGSLGVYQPRHARPRAMTAAKAVKRPARKKAAKKRAKAAQARKARK
jgi:hypothetical protein